MMDTPPLYSTSLKLAGSLVVIIGSFIAIMPKATAAEIDFVHQVVPILRQHCGECHSGEESKGGFSINTRALFLDDDTAIPGQADETYFIELILEPDPDYMMPPETKARVPAQHLAILKQWVNEGMKWEPGFTFGMPTYEPPFAPRRPDLPEVTDGRAHPIDRIIDQHLSANDQPRPSGIDDSTFLRRVSLDLIGLLPSPEETRIFLADENTDKRNQKIEDLLARNISYTEHWLTFWNDLLRNDYDGTGFITKGRTQISAWLYDSLKVNKPFNEMVTELIAPSDISSAGFINGIEWRGTVSAGQTLPIQFSQSLSQSFLGINMKCASCHDSFIDRWTLAEAYNLAAIYSEEPLELHRCDKPTGEIAQAAWLFPEIGQVNPEAPKKERLSQLAALMTHPENGRVPRTIVNRLWGQLMGHGIVHPLDAMQTKPWSEDLLDWLASDFQDNGFDLKRTLRTIVTSNAYQSAASMQESKPDEFSFTGPLPKRLTAEQFIDAIWQITGSAPTGFHAPVARGVVPPELVQKLSFPSSWIWGPSVDNEGIPKHGEKILIRRDLKINKPIKSAGVIAAADNAFVLYLNNRQILDGVKWESLEAAPVTTQLRSGSNQLLMVAENRGPKPNAAGAFAALRIEYKDGTDDIIVTDEQWLVSETIPKGTRPARWEIQKLKWESARPLVNTTWKSKTDSRIGKTLAFASAGSEEKVRASLLRADDLMRSLGRPNRDQIVTSRPNEITTLEAIELSTSEKLMNHLKRGAVNFANRKELNSYQLVEEIYLATLCRRPSDLESKILTQSLGNNYDVDLITDLLWALALTPEFLFNR